MPAHHPATLVDFGAWSASVHPAEEFQHALEFSTKRVAPCGACRTGEGCV